MSLEAAYIVPHPPLAVSEIGRGEEAAIQSTLDGYAEVASRIAEIEPDTIFIVSPHTAYFADWVYMAPGDEADGNFSQFRAPQVRLHLDYDVEMRDQIEGLSQQSDIPAGAVGGLKPLDHGIMVPLYYLEKAYPSNEYKAVSIGGSALPRETLLEFGRVLAKAACATSRKCVMLVSGDLSHKLKEDGPYGFDVAGPAFDDEFVRIVKSGNLEEFAEMDPVLCESAAECGLSGFVMMAGALEEASRITGSPYSAELISHEGPFGVGYGVAAFEKIDSGCVERCNTVDEDAQTSPSHDDRDPLVELAERTIRTYICEGQVPRTDLEALPADVPARAGCFVSIHLKSTDELRGCIGTIEPVQENLSEEIVANAVSASTRDPRFPAISSAELDDLKINVDVLFPPEPATLDQMDPKRYGIIVTQGYRRGLLLPDLDGVDTVEQQYSIACSKAGIDPFTPPEDVEIERFEVIRHE